MVYCVRRVLRYVLSLSLASAFSVILYIFLVVLFSTRRLSIPLFCFVFVCSSSFRYISCGVQSFSRCFFLGRFSYYVFCVCVCVYYTCRREEKNMNTQFVLYTLIAYVNLFLNRTKDKQQQKPCIHMPYENKTPINPVVYILAIESIIGKIG